MDRFMVKIRRPLVEDIKGMNHAKKYKLLKENSIAIRRKIITWIDKHGLYDQVYEITEATVFNILFITCTHKVAKHIENMNEVVSISKDIEFNLLG